MIRIAGDNDIASLARGSFGEMLHACDEWTRCVDDFSGAFFKFALHLWIVSAPASSGESIVETPRAPSRSISCAL
jgi:hypothetical protein